MPVSAFSLPFAGASSAIRASACARSKSRTTTALIWGSSASIRRIEARQSSCALKTYFRSPAASCAAVIR